MSYESMWWIKLLQDNPQSEENYKFVLALAEAAPEVRIFLDNPNDETFESALKQARLISEECLLKTGKFVKVAYRSVNGGPDRILINKVRWNSERQCTEVFEIGPDNHIHTSWSYILEPL